MIHVNAKPEPPSFDKKVRQKGLNLMKKNGINPRIPLPKGTELRSCWTKCLDDLHSCYGGICAYLAVYVERITGANSVDHFVPKKKRPDLAYEWSNYRLACTRINSRKGDYEDVLDPFEVENEWFYLDLITGRIYPNPDLDDQVKRKVQSTIDRLGLDDDDNRKLRTKYYTYYLGQEISSDYLKSHAPFVWMEADRQNLL
ncbi:MULTISPECIES: hypothetical protein [Dethiosulfovibrio]|uniref:TIGR02646 family protein n=2 Tax=Dethiosulfovibrio TaxID=47054 RepID=A0ABS9EN51_9BACT|nr:MULTISPECIES: hypothetical protein [Dethiosulfovibrio]MCF4114192.1 hypothetical protein [Dethiosulfovibrio russensis]MCF4142618.1 hypothetical protein [Dethiosulfovibrio marinus]MCF4145137.1 hypothetical protein [Dethiosulfovibrio acidaminovorans]